MSKNAPKELDIKAKILTRLRRDRVINKHTILTSEFSVGSSNLRADLALLSTEFIGIEIKSEFDSLRRLPNQLSNYCRLFDRVILVVAEKHLPSLSTMELSGADIWQIRRDGSLQFVASASSHTRQIEKISLISLLTKREIKKIKLQLAQISSDEKKTIFFDAFSERFAETSATFWNAVGRKDVKPRDLTLLSRFHEQRTMIEQSARELDNYNLMLAERWRAIS
jgi:hypothetical protein